LNEASNDGEPDQFDWVIPFRLASNIAPPDGIRIELELESVLDAAEHCYSIRNDGQALSPDASPFNPADPWLRVALGLAGSIAESLSVAAAFEVEAELLRRSGERDDEIAGRAMSIAASQEIIGIGHRLLNMVQRAICARTDYRELLRQSKDGALASCASYDNPRSADKEAWLSLNTTTVKALGKATRPIPHPSIRSAALGLSDLVHSAEWITLNEIRGEVFHRSRPESSVAAGLDGASGIVSPISNADGKIIGYSTGERTRYSGGDDRWKAESDATRAALRRIAAASVSITTALRCAVEPLTSGRRSVVVEPHGVSRRQHWRGWDDSRCSCCQTSAL